MKGGLAVAFLAGRVGATRIGEIRFNRLWFAATIGAAAALAAAAPSGLYLLAFLGAIIVTHEAGHYVVARWFGMKPTEFFWGFGPEVLSFRVGSCRYGVKAAFIGGYVKIEGMTPTSEVPEGFPESGTYRAASHWGRLLTILAGPAVNLVTAMAAFGLAELRNGASFRQSVGTAFGLVWVVLAATGAALGRLFAQLGGYLSAVGDLSGTTEAPVRFLSPVGQAAISGQVVESGVGASLQWFGILACAVGAINLLPLPPLDGSHAVVAIAEGVVQRVRRDRTIAFNITRLVPVAYVTIALFLALSVTALILDLRDLTAS